MQINQILAQELSTETKVLEKQVAAAIALFDEGATVPFVARYRKEVTGGLTDVQLRLLHERLGYFRELQDRKKTILESIKEQGKLTDNLRKQIEETQSKTTLEDLYLPYKPKRRTKAQIAREAGLEPLANLLLERKVEDPDIAAKDYLNPEKEVKTEKDALEGAKQILMERFSESAELLQKLRDFVWDNGFVYSTVMKDKEVEGQKFKDYFEYKEAICKIPSHRALALFRGRNEKILSLKLSFEQTESEQQCLSFIARAFNLSLYESKVDKWLEEAISWTWKIKLALKLELELFSRLREQAELDAIKVFQNNLTNLLMAAPAGNKVTMGLDPGLRTGVKLAVVDGTGKLLAYETIFPHVPRNEQVKSMQTIVTLCDKYKVELLSIGNGTASRETETLVEKIIKQFPKLNLTKIVVSEAGASVYSASELAAKEFPKLDVSYRGAVSIARRLQDPLAELVKIDPKAIGVGQYQHDVNQVKLNRSLNAVLEDCVNAVGANVNTASVKLLASISGLSETLAQNIVDYREANGSFKNREALKSVPRLGEKTYEQAIGFLRIMGGENPLDASAVHPESYPVVEKIMQAKNKSLKDIMGNHEFIVSLHAKDFASEKFGLPTIRDIFDELQKPGRDPRPEFVTVKFADGVHEITDLSAGMKLDGVVTNVTNFGAFVDVGVHQDGLVHVSELSDTFVKDPHDIVKVGQIVKVTVMEVDVARKRIQLSMKTKEGKSNKPRAQNAKIATPPKPHKLQSGFAAALSKALK